jgi:membrane protease YdiL (CAAX protease family)
MRKLLVSICLLLGGLAVFVLGSPYYSVFPTNGSQVYILALTIFFLVVSVALKGSRALARYAPSAYGLFIASAAFLFLSSGLLELRRGALSPLQDLALDKLSQCLHVVLVIIILTLVARADLKSIFIARGNLKAGLVFGGVSFLLWAGLAYLLQSGSGSLPQVDAGTILLLLVFVCANAIMEELWFRAIFLKRYESIVGRLAAILVTSAVFGASHVSVTYEFPGGDVVFGIVVFVLGVVGAYSMYKTDSLIGAVLFHAGYDLTIIVPVLNSG